MQVELPVKIHNRFDIEVKDVLTGEIIERRYAENIVLDSLWDTLCSTNWATIHVTSGWATRMHIGSGTGTLSPARTTLFSKVADLATSQVELVMNQGNVPSYRTVKLVLSPAEYIGITFTEVGLANGNSPYALMTHALLKDSEGNPLSLGPKTATQEITIYATVYLTLDTNTYSSAPLIHSSNSILMNMLGGNMTYYITTGSVTTSTDGLGVIASSDGTPTNQASSVILTSGLSMKACAFTIGDPANHKRMTNLVKFLTSDNNHKIKSFIIRQGGNPSEKRRDLYRFVLPSLLWEGWLFDKTPVGVGDGIKTVFNLPWDEVRLDKAKVVYVDGVPDASATWTADNITFNSAPADQAIITADYWVDYIPKDSNHELWVQFVITFAEGV